MSLPQWRKGFIKKKKKKTQKAVALMKRMIYSVLLKLRAFLHRYHKQSEKTEDIF